MYKKFDCGCQFEIKNGKLHFDPDIEKIPLDCPATWELFHNGNLRGSFQCESQLTQSFSKKLKPSNIEHLAALISIVRPGVLDAELDGKGLTSRYIDRKNGEEEVTYYHPALEQPLKETYGILVYQEQVLEICKKLAGFSLQEADTLRKAMGKKKADTMAECKIKFIDGAAKQNIVNTEIAKGIFDWIEKGQKYLFNRSHAVSYGLISYITAYCKAHFPKQFFTSYLYFAEEKIDPMEEIKGLVNNAKQMGIDIYPPNFKKQNEKFQAFEDGIYFGLADIKGVGQSVIQKLKTSLEKHPNWREWSWVEFLLHLSDSINVGALRAMISVGAFDYFRIHRTRMLYELDTFNKLTKREVDWLKTFVLTSNHDSTDDSKNNAKKDDSIYLTPLWCLLKSMLKVPIGRTGAIANKKRAETIKSLLELLENPPHTLDDSPNWIASVEEELLGIALTCTKVEESKRAFLANCTCKDYLDGKGGSVALAVKIDSVREITTKNGENRGKKMAFLNVSDQSGSLDSVVIFPNYWGEAKRFCVTDNLVMISGRRDKKQGGLIVDNVSQL